MDAVQTATIEGKGRKVAGITISHPDRVVFPADGVAKLEVATYYERVSKRGLRSGSLGSVLR